MNVCSPLAFQVSWVSVRTSSRSLVGRNTLMVPSMETKENPWTPTP